MANALQELYGELLLDKIRADRYPSVNHMNMLEEIARRWAVSFFPLASAAR